jgi:hypothetical protein
MRKKEKIRTLKRKNEFGGQTTELVKTIKTQNPIRL